MPPVSAEDWSRAKVVPGPGDGTLARIGPVVLLVGSTDPDVVKPYLDHARMVAANGGQGRQLVRGYALMLSTAVEQSPGFAALAPHTTGLAVFVDGDVTVTVDGQAISGADSLAWVERLIPWPVDSVTVTVAGASAPTGPSSYRLDGGVVPAGSFGVVPGEVGDSMMVTAPMAQQPTDPTSGQMAEATGEVMAVPAMQPEPATADHTHEHEHEPVAQPVAQPAASSPP
ncbi:hypothetical protein E7Z54_19195, partial [Nocardioides sp.]